MLRSKWDSKVQDAERLAKTARQHEAGYRYDMAFQHYLRSAQSYLSLSNQTDDLERRKELRAKATTLADRATDIKKAKKDLIRPVERIRLSEEEQNIVLDRSSVINAVRCPIWELSDEAVHGSSSSSFDVQPLLSPSQLDDLGGWQRASKAFPAARMVKDGSGGRDVQQDNIADCSLLAAFIVGIEHHCKFGSKLALSCLYPQDSTGLPIISADGHYSARFFVNGSPRRVDINDLLPFDSEGRAMTASTVSHDQLWPALIEKAYMKLMGGYDFGGSNSSIDMYALSGWIPEELSLQRSGYQSEKTWSRIVPAFDSGRCVVTIGTSTFSEELSPIAGLVSSHNYAVLGFNDTNGHRTVEVLNPWRTTSQDAIVEEKGTANERKVEEMKRTLIVDWDTISAHFESLYINWDPKHFIFSDAVHCSLKSRNLSLTSATCEGVSTQLHITRIPTPSDPAEIWLLLTRHDCRNELNEFVGMFVTETWCDGSKRTASVLSERAPSLVDSPHVLYRFIPSQDVSTYTTLISYRGSLPEMRFTLQAFSTSSVKIEDGSPPYPYIITNRDQWTERTAGGNHTCSTFMSNPQFRVTLAPLPGRADIRGDLDIRCEADRGICLNVRVLKAKGERVSDFENRDVMAGSSDYSYGASSCEARNVRPDVYTVVVSTFKAGTEAPFTLIVNSTLPIELATIPQEGAGMFTRTIEGCWRDGIDGGSAELLCNPQFVIGDVTRATHVRLRLQTTSSYTSPTMALSVFSTDDATGELLDLIESTGDYSDAVSGVVTRLFRLDASTNGYAIIPSTFAPRIHASFKLFLYADQPLSLSQNTIA